MNYKNQYSRLLGEIPMNQGNEKGTITQWDEKKGVYKTFRPKSVTEPDLSMSPMEILARFRMGLSISGGQKPIWHGDIMIPDYKNMDYADLQEYRNKAAENLEYLRAQLNIREEELRKKSLDETIKRRKEMIEEIRKSMKETGAPASGDNFEEVV